MKKFGDTYSQYYDLLYQDKDYVGEVDYIDNLIAEFGEGEIKTILDMGCGTGRHAELLCDKGYSVHGVDLSQDMLDIAEQRRRGRESSLSFSLSNISELDLNKKFDTVTSLFHVASYQSSNEDLIKFFKVAKEHLNIGGVFIFDFWYGPAVLVDLPVTRVKRLESQSLKVTRLAEPVLIPQRNIVDVNYDIFLELGADIMERKQETHSMRYLFDPELEIVCDLEGFSIECKYEWMSGKSPSLSSWNVVWVVRKL
jgi:SAM-dependent methyltransferase